MKIKNPGEVEILKLLLKHKQGTLNLITYTVQIDIFESIKAPVIRAQLLMKETVGLLDTVPMVGSTVELEYTTETEGTTEFKFIILSVDSASATSSNTTREYVLNLASEEIVASAASNISQNFIDLSHEKIIAIIIDKHLKSKKKFNYEATLGLDTIPLTKLKPFQAIDKVRRRSVSKLNKSSSYCFYENKDGYNFATIEGMIFNGKKNVGDRYFFLDTVGKETHKGSDWRNILGFEQVRMQNMLDMISNGGVKINVWSFNVQTGEYKKAEFNKVQDDGVFKSDPETYNLPKDLAVKYSDSEAVNLLIPISDDRELDRVQKHSYLRPYVTKILSNMINVSIHGDSTMTVGKMMHLDIPIVDGMTSNRNNELLSGNYLITKLRHIIVNGAQPKYMQSCELLRTGFLKE